jgi:drug/metabolite transporter (DMT)-like permease
VEIALFPMILLGIGSSGIAFLSFYKLIDDVGAVAGSITVYIIPIFSVIFGYIFLDEYTSNIQMIGIFVVIISAYQFSKKRN